MRDLQKEEKINLEQKKQSSIISQTKRIHKRNQHGQDSTKNNNKIDIKSTTSTIQTNDNDQNSSPRNNQ